MRKAKFSIESFGAKIFEGFTRDEEWNGWACPYFTFEAANKIVESHKSTGQKAWFDDINDKFIFVIDDNEEFYQPINNNGKKLYPIGNSSWIWDEII